MSDVEVPESERALSLEIAGRREAALERIRAACERSGRDPSEVRLIAITKGFPVSVVRAALAAGCVDLGENRVQELDQKAGAVAGGVRGGRVRWHLVGSLQRNKARRAVEIADTFHALDSARLARELDRRAEAAGRVLPCYVQVNVSGEGSKSGVAPDRAEAFVEAARAFGHLEIVGLMALAAPAEREHELETVVRPQLRLLADLARRATQDGLPMRLSMGMSGDYEIAVEEGATDVRLGTALFGPRAVNRR